MRRLLRAALALPLCFAATGLSAQRALTTPKQALGFDIGDDYMLATYTQLTDWWKKLDARVGPDDGSSTSARPPRDDQWMAIITRPENIASSTVPGDLRAACPRRKDLTDDQAHALAARARRWCGSTAACTPPKSSARISSWRHV